MLDAENSSPLRSRGRCSLPVRLHDPRLAQHLPRPAVDAPLLPRLSEAGPHTLAEADALPLRDQREDR
jgi:hypothetical protein